MRLQDLFPGSFSSDDFKSGPQTFTIKAIGPIIFKEDGEERQKGKMTFAEVANYWVFGKEAAGPLAEQIGSDDTDDWVGHRITLHIDKTMFKGKMVDCVRAQFADVVASSVAAQLPASDPAKDAEMEAMRAEIERLKNGQSATS